MQCPRFLPLYCHRETVDLLGTQRSLYSQRNSKITRNVNCSGASLYLHPIQNAGDFVMNLITVLLSVEANFSCLLLSVEGDLSCLLLSRPTSPKFPRMIFPGSSLPGPLPLIIRGDATHTIWPADPLCCQAETTGSVPFRYRTHPHDHTYFVKEFQVVTP